MNTLASAFWKGRAGEDTEIQTPRLESDDSQA
jgi:hypothetical protein